MGLTSCQRVTITKTLAHTGGASAQSVIVPTAWRWLWGPVATAPLRSPWSARE
jgi:hypothetical protein